MRKNNKRRPQVYARVIGNMIHINLDFRSCRLTQIKGKATWILVDTDMMAPFKVQVGELEIQPKIICKIIAKARGPKARLHLARQEAKAALSNEIT